MKKLIDLILYGNYWIAICALAMVLQTQIFLGDPVQYSTLSVFIFSATFFLYAAHRIVGISRLSAFFDVDRYQVIARFKFHIFIYAAITGIASLYFFFYLSWSVQLALVVPGILSLGYVIPFLGNRKRLRDLNHIKIYLVAVVWAWVTVGLPAIHAEKMQTLPFLLMALERAFFIFAITLPFDIRDMVVDKHSGVKTIPSVIGLERTKQLGLISAVAFCGLVFANYCLGTYLISDLVALLISGVSTWYIIRISDQGKHDYFYSGLVDGTMLIQFLLVVLGRWVFGGF